MKLLLQLLVLTIIGIDLSSATCSFLLNGDCFLLQKTHSTWYHANFKCKHWGGKLASVRSHNENSQIGRIIEENTWIGYNDHSREGYFQWTDGYRRGYTNWNSGEPNNKGNEQCVEMLNSNKKWNDKNCAVGRHYLCRKSFTCSFRLNGDCFLHITTPATWYQAYYNCKVWGGNLASVRSQYERSQIVQRITGTTWIGYNDHLYENNFKWVDGYSGRYTDWSSGEPNNWDYSEQCVEIRNKKWNDQGCQNKRDYLCRK